MERRWIYFFGHGEADGGAELKNLVGGKGASLGAMTRAGLNVPAGFTLSTECCAWYDAHGQTWPPELDPQLRAHLARLEHLAGRSFGRGEKPLLVAVRSGAAQSMPGMMDTVLNVGLNPDCVRAMGQRTGNPRGAWEAYLHFLRMFAHTVGAIDRALLADVIRRFLEEAGKTDEDALDAPQLEALCTRISVCYRAQRGHELPTDPWAMLCAAINAVFASWHGERAVTYRRDHHIDDLLGTAVNVQMMCPSEVSGVLFTANPVNPARGEIIIESAYGLGEAIVLGEVTPDRFVLDKETLACRERIIAVKEKRVATLAEDGRGQTGANDAASLSEEQVRELARLGLRVEAFFKEPCDIEWGLSQGQFYLLQARTIKFGATAVPLDPGERAEVRADEIAALRAKAEPGGTVWSRYILAEILPEPTPMSWAIVRQFMSVEGGYGLMYRDLGFDPDPLLGSEGIFDLICGRPYCNLSREPRIQYRSLPFEHSFALLKKNPQQALHPQASFNPAKAGWRFYLTVPLLFVKQLSSHLRLQRLTRSFAEEFEQRIVPAYLAEVASATAEDWSRLSGAELLKRFHFWIRRTLVEFARESLKPTALADLQMANLVRALTRRLQPAAVSASAAAPRAEAALRELMIGVKPAAAADIDASLEALQTGRLTRAEFLARFGHRGPDEMELASPRWSEDIEAIDSLIGSDDSAQTVQSPSNPEQAWQTAWQKLADEAKLLPAERTSVEAELRTLQRYVSLRETAKHYLLQGYALIRRALVELDRRYELKGDIFFLTPDELPRLVAEPAGTAPQELLDSIAKRRHRRAVALSLYVPHVLFSDDLEALDRPPETDSAGVLQGVPLSSGIAEGTALVVEDVRTAKMPPGDYILVCAKTDPAWVRLVRRARGLVMETGGVLSHGAIVARNYNLPAVAGIPEVLRRIKTGQRLRIDGATGKVVLLS
jgi:rifampicin phosphotransferase